jgi:DNA-3-methyladenine glycosylase II
MPHEEGSEQAAMNGVVQDLKSVAPYDFFLSNGLFPSDHTLADRSFRMAARFGGRTALISVTDLGSVEHPQIRMSVQAIHPISGDQIQAASILCDSILNLSLDLTPFYRSVSKDSVLGPITRRLRGLKPRKTPTIFEAVVRAILEQQISLAVAHRIQDRLIQTYGERLSLGKDVYYTFPDPAQLAEAREEDLRACGLSRNKATYIRSIARDVAGGSLRIEDLAKEKDTDRILSRLTEIRGIGTWTAEMVLLRGFGRYAAFPAADLGLRRTLSHFYRSENRSMSEEEARQLAEEWGSWKGLAGFYLIAAEITGKGRVRTENGDRT